METQLTTNARADKTAPTFHPFSRLPIELRIKIWEELIPELHTRLLWVREPGWMKLDKKKFASILLSVSYESREVLLKRFPVGLKVCKRWMSLRDTESWFPRLKVSWSDVGVVYIHPERDVLVIGQPWPEYSTCSEPGLPFTGDEFTLLAKPLRRQIPRDRIRNVIEFPHTMVDTPGSFDVNFSEEPGCETERIPEDVDGKPTDDWNFGGVTKRLTLTAPLDNTEVLELYEDSKEMSGSEMLEKWGGKFTVS
ncbi:hypothetical protein PG993_009006 [Apiospora rasikravindrae]|uniref:2EXR domain-containing protein n=1 Tax=Apiospora rasikravindrae TaxID=990691 RepID=A0ABR1SJF6_9PEZI